MKSLKEIVDLGMKELEKQEYPRGVIILVGIVDLVV